MSQILECYEELLNECDRAIDGPHPFLWVFFATAAGLLTDKMTDEVRAAAQQMQWQRYAKRIG